MSSFSRNSKTYNELLEQVSCKECDYPRTAQRYIYEVIQNHFLTNSQQSLGFAGTKKYTTDYRTSDISLSMGHNIKLETPDKLPAVYVIRGDARFNYHGTFKSGRIGTDTREGSNDRAVLVSLPITVVAVDIEVAPAEMFAHYVAYPFLYFPFEIKSEYGFHKLSVTSITAPAPIETTQKQSFMVQIQLEVEYFQKWNVQGDYLRLKNVSADVRVED